LSLATHQIRSPLTAIKGYSSMLLEKDFGELPVKAREPVRTIMASCQHLIDVVEDFLNISRIEQGRMVYEKETFDLKTFIKESVDEMRPNAEKAGLTLHLDIMEDSPLSVTTDKNKLRQIFHNLFDNAIKYTPNGKIEISVFRYHDKAEIAVKDSGVGIDSQEIYKLFNKFSRTHDAHKQNVAGTGLGLYIAKKMIEAQNGTIRVSSPGLGKGSTFNIEIPLAR